MRSDQWPRRAKSLHRNFVQKIITSNQCNTTTCASLRICLAGEMKRNHPHADNTPPHFRTVIPSENGGSVDGVERERNPIRPHGGTAPTSVCVSQTDVVAHDVRPLPLCSGWTSKHEEKLKRDEQFHRRQSIATGKPWTLEADKYTRAVLADCPPRPLTPETESEYRRVYARLCAEGVTAWEKANSAQHWNKLRTACRWVMAEDARAWRALSEQARKAGDIARAQECTAEAWRLAVALDDQFLGAGHPTWADKAKAMKASGQKPVDKSKRRTCAPVADIAPCSLLTANQRGTRLAERHSERLTVLALTGCRPAELQAGVAVRLWHDSKGRPAVVVEIQGAKVDAQRGHAVRRLGFPLAGAGSAVHALAQLCKERGGRYTLTTTPADYRSLNRALQGSGLSCYAFRHAVGSDLKADIASGKATPEQAARTMGHRSTESLAYYGTRSRGRGGQRPRAMASATVKKAPMTRSARTAGAKAVLVEAKPSPLRARKCARAP